MVVLVSALTVVVVLLGVLVVGLLRSHAEILRALHGLGVTLDPDADDDDRSRRNRQVPDQARQARLGDAADVSGVTPAQAPIAVSVAGADRLTLLAFLSSGCLTCRSFWDAFNDPGLEIPGNARLVIVTRGPDAESPGDIERVAPTGVVTVMSNDAWDAYDVPGSPYVVLVDGSEPSVVGAGTGTTWTQVSGMLATAVADAGVTARHRHPPREPGRDNMGRIDADLRAAGIGPSHPSLRPGTGPHKSSPDPGAPPVGP
jgi:hypothetical protein